MLWLCGLLLSLATLAPGATGAQPALLGRLSFPTSGAASAQPAFVRGVLLLHSFEYDDAIAAFREAERLDPGFAMAYWGEAMCYNQPLWYNEELAKARAALSRLAPTAVARAAKAPTPREKGYLDAVERLYGNGDKAARHRAYAERMAALAAANPADDEAAVFYALALLGTIPEGARRPEISMKAGAIAAAVLKKNPQHPGAAHYVLHAYDDGEHAALGLEAARIYARIAPSSSHARHMPSHVFLPLGMWDDAAASDESAFAASVERVKRLGLPPSQQDFHSLGWLQYEYLQQGRFAKAREAMTRIMGSLGSPGSQGSRGSQGSPGSHHEASEIGRGFDPMALRSELASMRARLVVESGDWAQMKGQGSFDNLDELFALGLSSVHLHDLERADVAVEHLQTASKTVPDADARSLAAIMAGEVQGAILIARGNRKAGLDALARAAAAEAARPKPIARPYPIKPAGELYAESLAAAGDHRLAVAQFKAALVRTPNRPASLLGLARSASAAGLPADAAAAARAFLSCWHAADPGRPETAEARRIAGVRP